MKRCGNCCAFEVKNQDEANLAKVSLDESHCRPVDSLDPNFGKQKVGCHGGHVRGACRKWQQRAAQGLPFPADMPGVKPLVTPMVESGYVCPLWEAGGPVLKGQPGKCAPTGSSNVSVSLSEHGKDAVSAGIQAMLVLGGVVGTMIWAVRRDKR